MKSSLSPARAVVAGGLVAGTLDLVYAFVYFGYLGVTPIRNVQSIASGVLGRAAYQGGWTTGALGIVLHMAILIVASALLYATSRRFPWIAKHPTIAGLLYGACIFAFMNAVVLPLSAIPFKVRYDVATIVVNGIAHMLLVGLPIGWSTAIASRR
jgi:hypothetical protein